MDDRAQIAALGASQRRYPPNSPYPRLDALRATLARTQGDPTKCAEEFGP